MKIDLNLEKLIEKLPFFLRNCIEYHPNKEKLIEIVLDLGCRPEIRFPTGPEYLSKHIVSWEDLEYITKRISSFNNENRAGIEFTLHRISCIRNRQFLITGLTCRIGRAVYGNVCLIRDLLESNNSLLILGKPGVGKTTIIREIARVLSNEMKKRVIIVDTSNEIAGNTNIPHSAIGKARRMQVSNSNFQHQIMLEAIENHMPQIIVIDEIGTELEALTISMIAEKGIKMIATTHGSCLESLIKNTSLNNLIGGIEYVTLSDEEAKRRKIQKTILERKTYPAFQTAIEINEQNLWTIHEDIKNSIDLLLRQNFSKKQVRQSTENHKGIIKYSDTIVKNSLVVKNIYSMSNSWTLKNLYSPNYLINSKKQKLRIYIYSISSNLIKEVLSKMNIDIIITKNIKKTSLIMGLKNSLEQNQKLQKLAQKKKIPIYKVNQNTLYQVTKLIQFIIKNKFTTKYF